MTLNTTINQIYDLVIGGHINGEKFTKTEFRNYVSNMFRTNSQNLVIEVCLPDGRWFCNIYRVGDGFDYEYLKTWVF